MLIRVSNFGREERYKPSEDRKSDWISKDGKNTVLELMTVANFTTTILRRAYISITASIVYRIH